MLKMVWNFACSVHMCHMNRGKVSNLFQAARTYCNDSLSNTKKNKNNFFFAKFTEATIMRHTILVKDLDRIWCAAQRHKCRLIHESSVPVVCRFSKVLRFNSVPPRMQLYLALSSIVWRLYI